MNKYRLEALKEKVEELNLLVHIDVLVVGATGVGKSSTINSLFGQDITKVGIGVDPETKIISSHKMHNYLRFHDSAGLGDGKEADLVHSKSLTSKLLEYVSIKEQKFGFIDLVLVILDGGSRDFGTTFKLLENVILKSIEPERVMVVINQADMAMKGNHWDLKKNKPTKQLFDYLDEKVVSVQARIKEATGLTISKPIYFSAYHKYNINAVMDYIIEHLPKQRRDIN